MSLRSDGDIDCAFIRRGSQRTGMFRKLFSEIENETSRQGISRLWVHASLIAQPAFLAVGFDTLTHEVMHIRGCVFERAGMRKIPATAVRGNFRSGAFDDAHS